MEAHQPHIRPSSPDTPVGQQQRLARADIQRLARPTTPRSARTLGSALAWVAPSEGDPHSRSGHGSKHLTGALLPSLQFESAAGQDVELSSLACGWLVVYCYPV